MKSSLIVIFAFATLLTINLASASGIPTQDQQQLLSAAMSSASCRGNFTISYLNAVISAVPSTSNTLSPQVSTIQNDMTQLQGYANAGNLTAFRAYDRSTFHPDLVHTRQVIQSAIHATNTTNNTRHTLRTAYNASLANYKSCELNAARNYANARLTFYVNTISFLQNKTDSLASRFQINASSVDSLLNNATTEVVDPLRTAINKANSTTQISAALDSYCLFDGCASGFNFHLDAKLQLQTLLLVLAKLQSIPGGINSTTVGQVQSHLGNASTELSSVGSAAYTDNQAQTIFTNLSDALKLLKSAFLSFYRSISGR